VVCDHAPQDEVDEVVLGGEATISGLILRSARVSKDGHKSNAGNTPH
jgi:hypothetical protein